MVGGVVDSADAPGPIFGDSGFTEGPEGTGALRARPLPQANHENFRSRTAFVSWACTSACSDCQTEEECSCCFSPDFQISHRLPVSCHNYTGKGTLGNIAPVY